MNIEMSQQELATFLRVDRSTIARWSRQGLPHHQADGRGESYTFSPQLTIWWKAGTENAEKLNGLDLNGSADLIAFGHALLTLDDPGAGSDQVWKLLNAFEKTPKAAFTARWQRIRGFLEARVRRR